MLVCDCGWQGVNLRPSPDDDTARCPVCDAVFQGIKAEKAVVTSAEEEQRVLRDASGLVAFAEAMHQVIRKDH